MTNGITDISPHLLLKLHDKALTSTIWKTNTNHEFLFIYFLLKSIPT